jgi:hypothetical protein
VSFLPRLIVWATVLSFNKFTLTGKATPFVFSSNHASVQEVSKTESVSVPLFGGGGGVGSLQFKPNKRNVNNKINEACINFSYYLFPLV